MLALILTEPDRPAQCHLAFDDDARNFEIQRPERAVDATGIGE